MIKLSSLPSGDQKALNSQLDEQVGLDPRAAATALAVADAGKYLTNFNGTPSGAGVTAIGEGAGLYLRTAHSAGTSVTWTKLVLTEVEEG